MFDDLYTERVLRLAADMPRTGRLAEIRGREDDRVVPGAVLGLVAVEDDGVGPDGDRDAASGPARP